MRVVLIGVVSSAKAAFDGLNDAGAEIAAVFTADVERMIMTSKMESSYFVDFKPLARQVRIPLRHVDDVNNYVEEISSLKPDLIYIIGWPQLVRQSILSIAPCIGMHPAPLPRRRGGAPLNWQLIDGERQSAVSLLKLGTGVDDGDILLQLPFEIGDTDYIEDVLNMVNQLTYQGVRDSFLQICSGKAQWIQQDHSRATVMRRRRPDDGLINWNDSALRIYNLIRAVSHPFPGAFSNIDDSVIKIWRSDIPQGYRPKLKAIPGEVLDLFKGNIVVSCRDYCIAISELQVGDDLPVHSGTKEFEKVFELFKGKVMSSPKYQFGD
jgi:methionyl-tRNA formyltransferase